MNAIKRVMLLLLILTIGLLVFFLTTTSGFITLIKLSNLILPGKIQVQHVAGYLTKCIQFDTLDYADKNMHIHITHGQAELRITSWRRPELTITSLHLHKLDVTFNAKSTPFKPPKTFELPKLPINVDIQSLTIDKLQLGSLVVASLRLQAFINHEQWKIEQFNAHYEKINISLQGMGQLEKKYPLSASLSLSPLSSEMNAAQGMLTLSGDTSLYRWQGKFTGPVPLKLSGTLQDLEGKQLLHANLSWGANTLSIVGNPLTQLEMNASIPEPTILHPSLMGLQTKIVANGVWRNNQGALKLTIAPGIYHPPEGSTIPALPFEGGHLLINNSALELHAKGEFTLDRNKTMDLTLHLPNASLNKIISRTQIIQGRLNLQVNALDFLQAFSRDIQHPHGKLHASISATGTLEKPDLQGTINLSQAGLTILPLNLTLSPIDLALKSHHKEWEAEGSIRAAGSGQLIQLKGHGFFSPGLTGEVSILGDDFPLIKTPEYLVNVSPQLVISIKPNAYHISGTILLPKVQVKLMTSTNTEELTEDAVFVHEETKTSSINTNVTADVNIKMGHDVAIDVQGLHGFLDGAIQVKQAPNSPFTALGELNIRDGTYKAHGQDLSIDHGSLLFTGGALSNPHINLRATRKFDSNSFSGSNQLFDFNSANLQTIDFGHRLTVGIQVAGHLNSPKITLFSIPARLSQADILSMLLLGKPANQASQSGGQLLFTAISAMNLDSGSKGMQLLSELKDNLGLDFNVQTNTQMNQKTTQTNGGTAISVGRSISKRLYLSYNMGLSQEDSNVLTLKYLLNKYFSIQVTASDAGNGLDVLYNATP